MSDVYVNTQIIEVSPAPDQVELVTAAGSGGVTVVLGGPVGPAGADGVGGGDMSVIEAEIDTRIATHNQAEVVHPNASSGRDFAALFLNGLV